MKLAYLLGSGVSINAGMPSTEKITERILSGKNIYRDSDEIYKLSQNSMKKMDEHVERIVGFLTNLKNTCDLNFLDLPERYTNYEDFYYLANTIRDNELNHDNPIVQPLVYGIIPTLTASFVNGDLPKFQLKKLAQEASDYIRHIVKALLDKEPKAIDYLNNILFPCSNRIQFPKIDVFTLNHDTLIETYFKKLDIKYIDGFGEIDGDVRWLNLKLFDDKNSEIQLLKLHGSINWVGFDRGDEKKFHIGMPTKTDIAHLKDNKGRELGFPRDRYPEILIGTLNKFYEYTLTVYVELQKNFSDFLSEATHLVICGYGFGDRVINRHVDRWQMMGSDHKITIVDRKSKQDFEKYLKPCPRIFQSKLTKVIGGSEIENDQTLKRLQVELTS